jgi:hypothetical protein
VKHFSAFIHTLALNSSTANLLKSGKGYLHLEITSENKVLEKLIRWPGLSPLKSNVRKDSCRDKYDSLSLTNQPTYFH